MVGQAHVRCAYGPGAAVVGLVSGCEGPVRAAPQPAITVTGQWHVRKWHVRKWHAQKINKVRKWHAQKINKFALSSEFCIEVRIWHFCIEVRIWHFCIEVRIWHFSRTLAFYSDR